MFGRTEMDRYRSRGVSTTAWSSTTKENSRRETDSSKPEIVVIDMTSIMGRIRRLVGGDNYFSYVDIKDYVKLIVSTPTTQDINEVIYDFDEHHLSDVDHLDLAILSFFHEMAIGLIDEYVRNTVGRTTTDDEYTYKELYLHTNALVLECRRHRR